MMGKFSLVVMRGNARALLRRRVDAVSWGAGGGAHRRAGGRGAPGRKAEGEAAPSKAGRG